MSDDCEWQKREEKRNLISWELCGHGYCGYYARISKRTYDTNWTLEYCSGADIDEDSPPIRGELDELKKLAEKCILRDWEEKMEFVKNEANVRFVEELKGRAE